MNPVCGRNRKASLVTKFWLFNQNKSDADSGQTTSWNLWHYLLQTVSSITHTLYQLIYRAAPLQICLWMSCLESSSYIMSVDEVQSKGTVRVIPWQKPPTMRLLLALRPELLLCSITLLLNARPCAVGVLTLTDSLHPAVAPVGTVSSDLLFLSFTGLRSWKLSGALSREYGFIQIFTWRRTVP